ncbi:hypothetical protein SDJN03_20039, partial [Cucurbita argyrosperma subsp. sororia]
MGGDSSVISEIIFSAPRSPRPSTDSKETEPISPPNPVTPNLRGSRKRSAPSPMSNPEHEPPTQRRRDSGDGNKLEYGEDADWSSIPLARLIGNMEEVVKSLKRVGGQEGLMIDPLLGCLVSSQTSMMLCLAHLISRTPPPPGQQRKGCPTSTNRAVKKNMK